MSKGSLLSENVAVSSPNYSNTTIFSHETRFLLLCWNDKCVWYMKKRTRLRTLWSGGWNLRASGAWTPIRQQHRTWGSTCEKRVCSSVRWLMWGKNMPTTIFRISIKQNSNTLCRHIESRQPTEITALCEWEMTSAPPTESTAPFQKPRSMQRNY